MIALNKYYSGDKPRKSIVVARGTHGGEEEFLEGFSGATRRKESSWKT